MALNTVLVQWLAIALDTREGRALQQYAALHARTQPRPGGREGDGKREGVGGQRRTDAMLAVQQDVVRMFPSRAMSPTNSSTSAGEHYDAIKTVRLSGCFPLSDTTPHVTSGVGGVL